jgi:hypothetical protein
MSGNGSDPPWILALAAPNVELPAFPRYVFARIPDERWTEFFEQVEGVAGYVRASRGGGPAHIPSTVVDALLARAPDGILQPPEVP